VGGGAAQEEAEAFCAERAVSVGWHASCILFVPVCASLFGGKHIGLLARHLCVGAPTSCKHAMPCRWCPEGTSPGDAPPGFHGNSDADSSCAAGQRQPHPQQEGAGHSSSDKEGARLKGGVGPLKCQKDFLLILWFFPRDVGWVPPPCADLALAAPVH